MSNRRKCGIEKYVSLNGTCCGVPVDIAYFHLLFRLGNDPLLVPRKLRNLQYCMQSLTSLADFYFVRFGSLTIANFGTAFR